MNVFNIKLIFGFALLLMDMFIVLFNFLFLHFLENCVNVIYFNINKETSKQNSKTIDNFNQLNILQIILDLSWEYEK